ncbi:MAG: DUF4292 domain-containing protein [Bacteroidales bacterium]|nr:DUF4292 domain-containing protein [Bacteroidales bacterium]
MNSIKIFPVKKISIFNIISLLLFLIISFSCKSTRHIVKEPLKEYGADYLFEQLKKNELKFDWFSAKFTIDYINDKKKTSFNGQVRMQKDSVIWVSFSPALGIEIARLLITNDSIKFLNRINNTYFLGDYNFVNDFLNTNIDYDILQSIILGNDFSYYENGKFRATYDSKEYHLVTAGRRKLKKYVRTGLDAERIFIQNIFLNPENFKITRIKIKEIKKENKKLEATYSDFKDIDSQIFPNHIDYDLTAENPIKISIDYSKISINKALKLPFRIPAKYTRIQ